MSYDPGTMHHYWQIFVDGYRGYARYLADEVTRPHWGNYFYWLIGLSLAVFLIEILAPWRKDQAVLRKDFWLDAFYMFFNFFLFSLVIYNAASDVVVNLFRDALASVGIPIWWPSRSGRGRCGHSSWRSSCCATSSSGTSTAAPPRALAVGVPQGAPLGGGDGLRRPPALPLDGERGLPGAGVHPAGDGRLRHRRLLHRPHLHPAIGHLNHANFRLPLGPLRYVLNNPQMHIWHHARDLPEGHPHGINYGLTLSCWDYLFGTAVIPHDGRDIPLGFPGMEEFPHDFVHQNLHGFVPEHGAESDSPG